MITKAIDVIKTTMSENCVEVLEAIEKHIQEMVSTVRGEIDHSDMIRVWLPVVLSDTEESCIRQVMFDAGWKNVDIRINHISFYFPS